MTVHMSDDMRKELASLSGKKGLAKIIVPASMEAKAKPRQRIKLPVQRAGNAKGEIVNEGNSAPQEAIRQVASTQPKVLANGAQRPPKRKENFEHTHKRFTNYLETDLLETIQDLNRNGEIQSMTAILNDAVYEYIHKYFPNEWKT